ncbi:MAG: 16S rRNA (cytosine(967)-C(5))-methyltransferase RsmB [Firmicutes bacterium]|nr:16S rRNA (cytosine(967)-C(5))-methyltransferase RsmB [Bacillota bacterium]
MSVNPRGLALKLLNKIEQNQAYSGLVLQTELKNAKLKPVDMRLVYRLIYGVLSYRLTIDYVIQKFCARKIAPGVRNILRLAIYQLLYLDRVPDFAVVNEAVKLASQNGGARVGGFVNAVLRNILRQRDSLFADLPNGAPEEISVHESHPRWLVDKWCKRWGADFTRELCAANNQPAPLTVRVNTKVCGIDKFCRQLDKQGIPWSHCKYSVRGIVLPQTPFGDVPGFDLGWFIAQGEASMLAVEALDPQPGDSILDMCSAPGGKATYLAELAAPGQVMAVDLFDARLKLVGQNMARLQIDNIDLLAGDATTLETKFNTGYDRILLDAPCSGFGVVRKKPEIKWSRSPGDLTELSKLQSNLLNQACKLIKPGGVIVYSTCTLTWEENEAVIEKAVKANENLRLVPFKISGLSADKGSLTLFPHVHGTDGFFIAKLQRMI